MLQCTSKDILIFLSFKNYVDVDGPVDSQYLPLTVCCPSLAFISLHDSAGSSRMGPWGTTWRTKNRNSVPAETSCFIIMVRILLKACFIVFKYKWEEKGDERREI